ncbi:hypothetical protein CYMTET_14305 [Cymbomonas tetramitiformis]|uniref:Uncharacterized protein n=1 Tax=Cymbomonas tetramitiformis TaxID=36881 RepID=A0AAE0GGS9_9CHLO|nr:hypothetical protein CYMTET_14305 [Cymbomonas tetramitiformis]
MTTTPTMTIAARVGAGGTETKTEKLEETEEPKKTEETAVSEETEETEETKKTEEAAVSELNDAFDSFGSDKNHSSETEKFLSETRKELFLELQRNLQDLNSGSDGKQKIWKAAAITMESATTFVKRIQQHIIPVSKEAEDKKVAASNARRVEELNKIKQLKNLKTQLTKLPSKIETEYASHSADNDNEQLKQINAASKAAVESILKNTTLFADIENATLNATHTHTAEPAVDDKADDDTDDDNEEGAEGDVAGKSEDDDDVVTDTSVLESGSEHSESEDDN